MLLQPASVGPEGSKVASVSFLNPAARIHSRLEVRGKFLFAGDDKIYIRGATYGTFCPDVNGCEFPRPEVVSRDFGLMAGSGLNAVRTYTVPPHWFLDMAAESGLRVMVGVPWEEHIDFLADKRRVESIESRVREGVRACAGHPAVLCYAVGNEIPSSIVRWRGRRQVEKFLYRLFCAAKEEDPGGLVTYVNYPSTEYLQLPFLDLCCFNVYLERREALEGYLSRLQSLSGNRPLVMGETGLDSLRHGLSEQAAKLDWQIRTAFRGGCSGLFIFAWTDEWHRGGYAVEDWDFGLVTRDRRPKPALGAVTRAFAEAPFPASEPWPRISVVVCTYNGSRTLRGCLAGLEKLKYPDYEVIVVNDGSTDSSPQIAREFKVRLITTENRGLSSARNTGMRAARGEIVAYIDDDAFPDPHWLNYLAATFRRGGYAAVGGPNIAPPGDGDIAECVVNAPGGPVHVLLSDTEAEHIPGCNMAFRKGHLEAIGGFDSRFRVAGDDVDVCWRIQQQGWAIGFSPAAVVWHHRRNSLRAYWRQQRGYGKAEALLEKKWPEKYNTVGHIRWAGRLYGPGLTRMLLRRQNVYHGSWGRAPFQSLVESEPGLLAVLPTMPEWYLVVLALAGLSAMGLLWPKLMVAVPLFLLAAGATLVQAVLSSAQARFPSQPRSGLKLAKLHLFTGGLHLVQPLARLWGRARHGLTMFRRRVPRSLSLPVPRKELVWSETWRSSEEELRVIVQLLRRRGAVLLLGGEYDRWDVEVRGGLLGAARLFMTVEEHGGGKQLFRFRIRPRFGVEAVVPTLVFAGLALGAAADQYWAAYDVLALVALGLFGRSVYETGGAIAGLRRAVERSFRKGI